MNQLLKQDEKVFFINEELPMTVNAVNENYAVCSRPIHRRYDAGLLHHRVEMGSYCSFTEAFNDNKDALIYSCLDLKNEVKGPHNSFGFGIKKETVTEDALQILEALVSGDIEISRRNSCASNIDWIKTNNYN